MIRLPTAAIAALRNRLRERGARPSLSLPAPSGADALESLLVEEYGPLCEAMYLLMAADQQITGVERDVIRGALRELDDRIRSRHIEAMISASADALARDGWEARLRAVGEAIGDDRARAEAAILLAAAVAYADGEIAPAENDVMSALIEVLGVSLSRTHELVSSLERVDEVLHRDERVDASDVVLHAAMRLRTPEDFERLAATTDRPDVTLVLRLYASFVRSGDDALDRETSPSSLSAARVEALRTLADALPEGRSPNLDEVRAAISGVVVALERVERATALRTLVDGSHGAPPLVEVERAVGRLSDRVARALERLGHSAPASASVDLRTAVENVIREVPRARDLLAEALDLALATSSDTVPSAVLSVVDLVLRRMLTLPVERPSAAPKRDEDTELPEWIPKTRTVAGWYVHRALGGGGSGSVFVVSRAGERDDPNAERFALKVPLYDAVAARALSEAEYLRVFRQEASALLSLPEHPNLAGFVTFDVRARPKPLLVMELVEGVDCHVLLQQRKLDARRVVTILDGVLAGLSAMHSVDVGHLDVKPSNVVLRPSGEPVLVDFGLAGRHIRQGCATPTYAAPEVWGHVDPDAPATPFTADVYAFGCVAYELLVGKPLFREPHVLALLAAHMSHDGDPEPLVELRKDARLAPVADFISSALRKNPTLRPSADALREALQGLAPRIAELPWPIA